MTGPDGSKAGGSTAAGSEPAADGGSDSAGTVTWRELLADATSALQVAAAQPHRSAADHSGGEPSDVAAAADPTLDAARIVAEAAGVTDAELFMVLDELCRRMSVPASAFKAKFGSEIATATPLGGGVHASSRPRVLVASPFRAMFLDPDTRRKRGAARGLRTRCARRSPAGRSRPPRGRWSGRGRGSGTPGHAAAPRGRPARCGRAVGPARRA